MAEAVVSIVAQGIKPLGDLIDQEAKILSGVGYQVELAQVELHLMGPFLKDADSKAGDDEVVRIWMKLIRDVAYDLEDVIESFALKVAFRRRGGPIKLSLKRFACIFSEGVDRHRVGSEIENIMSKLSSLMSSLQSYNIRPSDPERVTASKFQKLRDRRLTYAHEVESHIVGLEESIDALVNELTREGKRHRVVSIWGMGGSGKTTLAKQIFLQNEVKRHFDCFAWVYISQQCEGRDVWEEILIKLTSPTEERNDHTDLDKKTELGKKMLVHCSGLPLAINMLAGLLSIRESIAEWETIIGNVNAYIMRDTNVFESENTGQESGISGVLAALSYDDLPSQLKLCFLYLAQYPEDHEIVVRYRSKD